MAEGFGRELLGQHFEVHSAGVRPHGLDPRAVTVMLEAGVDISRQRSKHLDELADVAFDVVVTVCDNAAEACPVLPGRVLRIHRAFDDPPRLAREAADEWQALECYRRVRDEIRVFVTRLPEDPGVLQWGHGSHAVDEA